MSEAHSGTGGVFVAIIGPSGAGKDTLIAGARAAVSPERFLFPQRIITRAADATEGSAYLSPEDFAREAEAGNFLFFWHANGLSYALPGAIAGDLAKGRHVVANVSRGMVQTIRERLPRVLAVQIVAPPDVLAERIAGRNREDQAMQDQRIKRGVAMETAASADVTIDNSGAPEVAIAALTRVLLSLDDGDGATT
jgi:phosphonate metabolism protein PhnN/1,5-bisphosphokinase (PRPP-forming)